MSTLRTYTLALATAFALATVLPLTATPAMAAGESDYFESLDALPAADRYRQLSLMLMVSNGVDEKLLGAMENAGAAQASEGANAFEFEQYTTPLIRIVDQRTMVAGAAQLFRFTQTHSKAIGTRLEALMENQPEVATSPQAASIVEDAIIIRTAIADSVDYLQDTYRPETSNQPLSADYRARTIFLRNNLEYESYEAELDRLTGEAIAQVGGQTDAYERMFDDEVDSAALNKKIDAAEAVYGWDPDMDRRAARLAEEILENIWDRESDIPP